MRHRLCAGERWWSLARSDVDPAAHRQRQHAKSRLLQSQAPPPKAGEYLTRSAGSGETGLRPLVGRMADVRCGSWLRGKSETEFANRKFVPTSINLKNESAGDGRGDKTIEKTILRTFRARTFSRSQGQTRRFH